MRATHALVLVALLAGCGGATRHEPRAVTGVSAYVQALRADDPRAAWELLSDDVRESIAYDEFATAWRTSEAERKRQADELEEGLKGAPRVAEHAAVTYADGKTVTLHHDAGSWRLDSGLVSRTVAHSPLDAIELFAAAIDRREFGAVMEILTERRRDGINRFVSEFATSLRKQKSNEGISFMGKNRAELKWDENGTQYKVILIRENDEWRVDDFDITPAPEPTP